MTSLTTTSVKLESGMNDRLRKLAATRHCASHWLMRETISQYVEREEKRQSFHDDALKAWEEYQVTGLHVTMEEADIWLAELEAENDAEPPACHR